MNLLTVEDVSKLYGDKTIFDKVSMGIHEGDKIGLIGINGTGKSTLLKLIAGLETPDEGKVVKGNKIWIEYLSQSPEFYEHETVLEHVIRGKPEEMKWTIESDAKSILTKLGLPDYGQNIMELSGGQKKRAALAAALLTPADILILDEPTNHLDNEMSDWLEDYLKRFKGSIMMVTHDRYFLDSVTNKIVELDSAKLYTYETNYSGYLALKAQRMDMEQASYRKSQAILKNELQWMMRGARARSTKQKARIGRFEDLRQQRAPEEEKTVEISSLGQRLGRKTLELEGVSKSYGEKVLFKDFSYIFLKNDRIGIIGQNGAGKSTLLKVICQKLKPDSGTVEIGQTVKIGYFSQENEYLDEQLRVIDYIRNTAEFIMTAEGRVSASQMLERFLFTPDMQWTPVGKLSGGEKRRLYLLKVLMEAPNVLILDEPTNDLDIKTLTVLEDYLDGFPGIIITVSHDRYFLDRVVNRIFAFEGGGRLRQYEGGFTDYQYALKEDEGSVTDSPDMKKGQAEQEKAAQSRRPHEEKLRFTYKEAKEYETIDAKIEQLETSLGQIQKEILIHASDYAKLNELMAEKEKLESALEEKTERWIYLNDLAERIAAAKG